MIGRERRVALRIGFVAALVGSLVSCGSSAQAPEVAAPAPTDCASTEQVALVELRPIAEDALAGQDVDLFPGGSCEDTGSPHAKIAANFPQWTELQVGRDHFLAQGWTPQPGYSAAFVSPDGRFRAALGWNDERTSRSLFVVFSRYRGE